MRRNTLPKEDQERLKLTYRMAIVPHKFLEDCIDGLANAIADAPPGSVVLCCGPTGVGKTTLRGMLEKRLVKDYTDELESDPGRLAVVSMRIPNPEGGDFNWKNHYFQPMLKAMHAPLTDKKLDMSPWEVHRRLAERLITGQNKDSAHVYRKAVEEALSHRKPKAVLADEAQHLKVVNSARSFLDQMNTIKSMAEDTGIIHVLFGTYDLIPFRNLNGQMSRRGEDVHLRRYDCDDKVEWQEFVNALGTLLNKLPLSESSGDLVNNWDYFYERSLGCVGILKDWLYRSLSTALREGANQVTMEHLEARAHSVSKCDKMLDDIREGELAFAEPEEKRLGLRAKLKLSLPPGIHVVMEEAGEIGVASNAQEKKSRKAKRGYGKGRVGQRSAKRDRVGEEEAA